MRRTSVKVNLRCPRSTATSAINTCFCFPPSAPLLALQRTAIVARSSRVTRIPIAERAAPSAHITRGFVLWRLSDAGHRAHGTVVHGRHPKPRTQADMSHQLRRVQAFLDLKRKRLRVIKCAPLVPALRRPPPLFEDMHAYLATARLAMRHAGHQAPLSSNARYGISVQGPAADQAHVAD